MDFVPSKELEQQAKALIELWNGFAPKKTKPGEAYPLELMLERVLSYPHVLGMADVLGAVDNYRTALALTNSKARPVQLNRFLLKMSDMGFNYMDRNFTIEDFDERTFGEVTESVAEKHARTLENGL